MREECSPHRLYSGTVLQVSFAIILAESFLECLRSIVYILCIHSATFKSPDGGW